ncbi:MAG TPA: isocitrate lyase, partial [Caldilinea sp.]|nr:isocitrate lyase [Caldilinea sp.]
MYEQNLAAQMSQEWEKAPRWAGAVRPYTAEQVLRLRGSFMVEYTIARMGAERLWSLIHTDPFVRALGAVTGNQAVQMVQAGLKAIYMSGWQVAGDNNTANETYPDQSLYPVDSVPALVRRINKALQRADQISHMNGQRDHYWMAPIVADAESGFGGTLNSYELMRAMIDGGAAGVHFEDQLSSAKKCGHMGGKVLVPMQEFIQKLVAARLAADVMGVSTLLVARTDADSAQLLTTDVDARDVPFITSRDRTAEGFYYINGGLEYAIERGLAYAPHADLIWCETSRPDVGEAREFAQAVHAKHPGKLLS